MIDLSHVKLLIVDMDNTLCDTYHTLSIQQWERVALTLEHRELPSAAKRLRAQFGKRGFIEALQRCKLTPRQARAAVRAYDDVDVGALRLYPDARELLALPVKKVLVSRGERALQWEKIRHLKLKGYFDRIVIVPTFQRKKAAFQQILTAYSCRPAEALVIGDRIEEEISDARSLGIPSCLVLRSEWSSSRGSPDMQVNSLATIARQLQAV